MILLWGLPGDGPFDAVCAAVRHRGAPAVVLDQRAVLQTSLELSTGHDALGKISTTGEAFALEDVTAVYWRTHDIRRVISPDQGDTLERAFALEDGLAAWLEVTSALVVNRPSAMASNNSKPYQLQLLRELGFEVPRTLVTTDPDAVRRFWTECGSVIYKSISGTRSIVARLTASHESRLVHVANCPTQFQQFVPGHDHRVHVVGDDVYACEVVSAADDYRYAGLSGEPAELRPTQLPADITERCIDAARALGLHFAGIDLRLAPDGRWFCFEVNPSPGFTYYEAHTRQPIADAVANLLANAR